MITGTLLRRPVWLAALLLAGCASSPPKPALNQLHNEVADLTQKMGQLTHQAAALEQQGNLNNGSTQGAWLIPAADTGVLLKSQAGDITLSLQHVQPESTGTLATLTITPANHSALPTFSAQVEWGELDAASGKPLQGNSQRQRIEVPGSLMPETPATVELHLSNLPPEQLGYVRIHDVVVSGTQSAVSKPD